MSQELRDAAIHNAVETRRARDVKIMQGVNQAHREAFVIRLPGQIEHSMRLIAERLIACLSKPEGTQLEDPATWPASADDIHSLTQALWQLEQLRLHWPIPEAV